MSEEEARRAVIARLKKKADMALAAAEREYSWWAVPTLRNFGIRCWRMRRKG